MTGGISPTLALVRNFAEQMHEGLLGKKQRHSLHLKTFRLRKIDNLPKSADYAPYFRLFDDLVCMYVHH